MFRFWARLALPAVAGLFVVCVVIQVFLAGLGVFDGPGAFIAHRDFGYLFGWLTLAMLVLALVGRAPQRITGGVILLLVLFALQSVLVVLRADLPAVAALHPLNGFAILGIGAVTARAAWLARAVTPTPATLEPAPGTSPAPAPGLERVAGFERTSTRG